MITAFLFRRDSACKCENLMSSNFCFDSNYVDPKLGNANYCDLNVLQSWIIFIHIDLVVIFTIKNEYSSDLKIEHTT